VPPELVFDQGFGDLFVVRVAGNIVDPATLGSIDYAVEHLKTPLLVVLGHEQCGAVTAALEELRKDVSDSAGIDALLDFVKPSLTTIDPELSMTKQVALGVEANVRRAVEQLTGTEAGVSEVEASKVAIVGAVYELKSGRVRFLS
jgi:carbonic anhydrase